MKIIQIVKCNHLLSIDTTPPVSGSTHKYLLQKSSDVSKMGTMEPNITPIVWPVVLHVGV